MKNILITGGSKGIGKQLVIDFVKKGHQVAFTYQNSVNQSAQIVDELFSLGYVNVKAFKCDMGCELEVKTLFKENKDFFSAIDVVINNAGIKDGTVNGEPKPFIMTSSSEWWNVMHNNMNGVMNTCRAVLPFMIRRRSGRILNITSLSGIKGNPGQSAYASSKAAITNFSKSLSKEMGQFGITINCIAPGFIETEMVSNASEKYINERLSHSLLKRMGTTNELSNLVYYMAIDAPQYLINQEIVFDGGVN
jgi:3-oxoacyl-[acyl-carrier protein] reductase